jgi:hypothetical protein
MVSIRVIAATGARQSYAEVEENAIGDAGDADVGGTTDVMKGRGCLVIFRYAITRGELEESSAKVTLNMVEVT